MFLIEYTTKSGSLYTANPITKKIKKAGEDAEWKPYADLLHGHVGEHLIIAWPDGNVTQTTKVVKLEFPEVE